jgi:ectoine hydroxylase-related dioxygenase (phytanoyl-CoA dioxygenase family)
MAKSLEETQIEELKTKGATVLRQVIDEHWLQRLRAAIDRDMSELRPYACNYATDGSGRFYGNVRMWQYDPDFKDFCLSSPLPEIAGRLFGSAKVNLLHDQLFVKEPGTRNRTRWHNDLPYWPIRGRQILSFWVALDRTTRGSGALEFIVGSHLWNRWFQPETFGPTGTHKGYERNSSYEAIPNFEETRDSYEIASWDLEPGDVYVFDALTVHGAGGNMHSDTRRRGCSIVYTGDDVCYDARPGTNPSLKIDPTLDGTPLDGPEHPVVFRNGSYEIRALEEGSDRA